MNPEERDHLWHRIEIKMPNSYRFLGCKLPNVSVTDGESQNYGTILPFLTVMGGS